MKTNFPWNLLSDIYGEPIDENHNLFVRGCYLDINALPERLNSLPEDEREFVRLRYEEGMSFQKIADVTGKSYAYVRTKVHRCMMNSTFRLLIDADYFTIASNNWEDLLLFFPDEDGSIFLSFSAGTGDNLSREDVERGYVDYVNYTTYYLSNDLGGNLYCEFGLKELDGGMLMTKQPVKEMSLKALVDSICEEAGIKETYRWSVIVSK